MTVLKEITIYDIARVAFLAGRPSDVALSREKADMYLDTMAALHMDARPQYMCKMPMFDEKSGFAAMNGLLALPEPPTAIITTNDMTAAGAMQAIVRLGYSVPDDFSVLSFDNTFIAELTMPRLTSVGVDFTEYAEKLVDAALRAIEGDPPAIHELAPSLIVRDSCRKIG